MVTWGLLSGATALSIGPWSFLTMRFLLGYTAGFSGGLYALAGFALMSAIVSALGLRVPNPAARQEVAAVPAE
jgi:hypothetical protein